MPISLIVPSSAVLLCPFCWIGLITDQEELLFKFISFTFDSVENKLPFWRGFFCIKRHVLLLLLGWLFLGHKCLDEEWCFCLVVYPLMDFSDSFHPGSWCGCFGLLGCTSGVTWYIPQMFAPTIPCKSDPRERKYDTNAITPFSWGPYSECNWRIASPKDSPNLFGVEGAWSLGGKNAKVYLNTIAVPVTWGTRSLLWH